jgi:hypothetical protein
VLTDHKKEEGKQAGRQAQERMNENKGKDQRTKNKT